MAAAMLAHQGGWDEILMVAIPMLLFVVLLGVASRRAKAQAALAGEPSDVD